MTQERVKSKNLFNFRPQGFIDPDVLLEDEKMKKDFGLDPEAMEEQMKGQNEEEFVGGMREFMGGFLATTPFATDPAYVEVWLGIIQHSLIFVRQFFGNLTPS